MQCSVPAGITGKQLELRGAAFMWENGQAIIKTDSGLYFLPGLITRKYLTNFAVTV
jgi:hypothetical protein